MARTALTVPSAYNPDGVKANYDANIAASNDNFEELYGVETQTITTTPANITMPIVVLAYATGGAKVVKLPAVANTTLRRINVTKTVGVTSTATISPQTGEYLDGVQNGTLAMTDLGLSVTFQVIDGKWVSDWVGKSAAAPDGQNMAFKPGGTDKSFVFQTDVAAGGKLKVVDTTTGITDEYPATWIQANRIELGLGTSYVGAVLVGQSNGTLELHPGMLASEAGHDLALIAPTGKNLLLKANTTTVLSAAESSAVSLPVGATSSVATGTALAGTSLVGTGVTGTGTISATLIADGSANTGTNTAWADGDNTKLWFAQKFTAGATATATAVSLKLAKGNATAPTLASSTITAYIHADSTGAVGSVLTGGTGTSIRFDALTSTTPAEFYFGGMSASLTQGTAYWIVVKASAFETSAGSIVHDSKSATAGTYGTYNTGTSTWDYTAELAAWCKVHVAGGVGLSGTSTINNGVVGTSTVGYGGSFSSTRNYGVYGISQDNYGGYFTSTNTDAVCGIASATIFKSGVYGSGYFGVYGNSVTATGAALAGVNTIGLCMSVSQTGASTTAIAAYVRRSGAGYGPLIKAESTGTIANATSGNGTSNLAALLVTGGIGGAASATTGVTAGAGAGVSLTGGAGGAATGATGANVGGVGGGHELIAGAGGAVTSGTGTGGAGGGLTVTLGAGSAATATGGAGGSASITAGAGGNATTTGGAGGSITLTPGAGGTGGTPGAAGKIYLAGNTEVTGTLAASTAVTVKTFPVVVWRGTSTTDPSTDLAEGQMYWETDTGHLKIYTGSAWVVVGIGP